MVEGGPIDVLTGDYLAELTMLILWKARQKDPAAGYARTFLAQLEQVLGTCLDRGIKVVTNAGGLNPAGLADEVGKLAAALGLQPRVAYITGDDLLDQIPGLLAAGVDLAHLDTGQRLADARRAAGHGQRLPGLLGHHPGAGGRRGHRHLPAGHRRGADRGPGRLVAPLGPDRLRPAGGRGASRATSSSAGPRPAAATTRS